MYICVVVQRRVRQLHSRRKRREQQSQDKFCREHSLDSPLRTAREPIYDIYINVYCSIYSPSSLGSGAVAVTRARARIYIPRVTSRARDETMSRARENAGTRCRIYLQFTTSHTPAITSLYTCRAAASCSCSSSSSSSRWYARRHTRTRRWSSRSRRRREQACHCITRHSSALVPSLRIRRQADRRVGRFTRSTDLVIDGE